MRRLFVALMLGRELGLAVCAEVERATAGVQGLRRYGPGDVHLTLFFLGAVEDERALLLERELARALEGKRAPELRLAAAGAFPAPGRERVLWLGVEEPGSGSLAELEGAVRGVCTEQGFAADERPFHAHLTVARVKGAGGPRRGRRRRAPPSAAGPGEAGGVPEAFYRLDPGLSWQPPEVSLVESLGGGGEGAYRVVRRFPLEPS